jgi:DUF1680 family protein
MEYQQIVLLVLSVVLVLPLGAQSPKKDYPIQPVPFTKVHMTDGFWFHRMEINRTVTIPYALKLCQETGRIDNFAIAAGIKQGDFCSKYFFDDSDVYKVIEGASYAMMLKPDSELENQLDKIIELIGAAQEKDGYLYTARTMKTEKFKNSMGTSRWLNEQWSHELYNVGHMYEAAVAHYMATKKRTLLDIAIKSADLVDREFGPGRIQIPPGHEEIEIGLVKLYRATGDERYLKLAKFFLDIRGKSLNGRELWGDYNQDHKPVVEQNEAVGHAVRAAYLYSGMADVAALTGDKAYIDAIDKIWENVVTKKLYITGGIGASGSGEAFGANYELPNMSAYNETCASIANVFWNHRLFLLHGDGKYIDVLERTLYNALLSGIGMEGNLFFYPNPLASYGTHARSAWFDCACCPGNVTRFIASVPNYIYAVQQNQIYVNLYTNNEAEIQVQDRKVTIKQETGYPWVGKVTISVNPKVNGDMFTLSVRIPGWAQDHPLASDLYRYMDKPESGVSVSVNGEPAMSGIHKGYINIDRSWKAGDILELNLPMQIRRVAANEKVEADRGRVTLERGPIVFCAEWPDNKDKYVRNLLLPDDSKLQTEFRPDLLNGVQIIKGKGEGYIYVDSKGRIAKSNQEVFAIPYYAWAHRGKGEMAVWLAREASAVNPLSGPTLATLSKVTASYGQNPQAITDQLEPDSSGDHSYPFFHYWPHKGTKEWVQLDFPKLEEVSEVEIYWFDDTGVGECRVPKSWKIFYKDGEKWTPVYTTDAYGVEKDKYNRVGFETVRTSALKIEIQSQPDFAGGIHEVRIK